ncbi:unnamed protein product [Oncorhynchus mykiss]|uniref:Protein CASC3 n=1 Tax=Oncorhynchus mykiss TaxID=8022 RepID=A0A060X440_ONCMY|nr:unnamed protein product [Oncorhynchus mykiss]
MWYHVCLSVVCRLHTVAICCRFSRIESEDGVGEAVLSDYESADPEENGSHSEGGEEEEEVPPPAAGPKPTPASDTPAAEGELQEGGGKDGEGEKSMRKEVKCEDKGNLAGERQSGDGQESTEDSENKGAKPGQKLDDDQDRNNPAYIPRKGMFFEHDVRGNAQEEERPKGRNRKLWKDEGRWEHDRFREEEQAPKSREELVAIYGYDIRNGGVSNERSYRQRKPRHSTSPVRDKRWQDGDWERPVHTSWQQGGNPNSRSAPPAVALQQSGPPTSAAPNTQRSNNPPRPSSHPPPRGFQGNRPPQAHHRNDRNQESQRPGPKAHPPSPPDPEGRGNRGAHTERSPSVVVEEVRSEEDDERNTTTVTTSQSVDSAPPPRRQEQQRGGSAPPADNQVTRDASPAPERPVEKKSYSLARRTRTRATELGKQASLEEPASTISSSALKSEPWPGPGQSQGDAGDSSQGTVLAGLDQDLTRLSLAGPNWPQNPSSYLRAEMRGIPNSMHMGGAPPQYSNIEELLSSSFSPSQGAGNRAKRYSSQRQRPSPEPAPPMHIGVMEGHYYEPMSYQGPIYSHGDSPAPLPPQGILVQPEMHLPHPGHPGLHPHQSSGPMPNPALYAAPPVSMSPGQPPPQQLLAPPFYPPPGVMTFGNTNYPYPAGATLPPMYNPPVYGQSQVYGGVTYYDPMQQQAQPKPSPPRRSSQPVTVKPPPPEVGYGPE